MFRLTWKNWNTFSTEDVVSFTLWSHIWPKLKSLRVKHPGCSSCIAILSVAVISEHPDAFFYSAQHLLCHSHFVQCCVLSFLLKGKTPYLKTPGSRPFNSIFWTHSSLKKYCYQPVKALFSLVTLLTSLRESTARHDILAGKEENTSWQWTCPLPAGTTSDLELVKGRNKNTKGLCVDRKWKLTQ